MKLKNIYFIIKLEDIDKYFQIIQKNKVDKKAIELIKSEFDDSLFNCFKLVKYDEINIYTNVSVKTENELIEYDKNKKFINFKSYLRSLKIKKLV